MIENPFDSKQVNQSIAISPTACAFVIKIKDNPDGNEKDINVIDTSSVFKQEGYSRDFVNI